LQLLLEINEGAVLLGSLTLQLAVLFKDGAHLLFEVKRFLVMFVGILANSTFELRVSLLSLFAEYHYLLMELLELSDVLERDLASHVSELQVMIDICKSQLKHF